ncbi:hypothetical protein [Candidatus Scalindua japonica]|nr:hypothetical protein [Candidatus Scalindua japonica]
MPEVFGCDVINAIYRLESVPETGIITGCGERLKSIVNKTLKVNFIIRKPFNSSELLKCINKVFDEVK